MTDRDLLGDHPAHRGADDVGALDAEVVQEPDGVGCHVREEVAGAGQSAGGDGSQQLPGRRRRCVDDRRAADVAVVEADDPVAVLDEAVDQGHRPGDHLGRQAHDEQDGRAVVGAVDVVFEGQAVGRCDGHGPIMTVQ